VIDSDGVLARHACCCARQDDGGVAALAASRSRLHRVDAVAHPFLNYLPSKQSKTNARGYSISQEPCPSGPPHRRRRPGAARRGAAGRGASGGVRTACGSRPGAGERPARGPWSLYPFGYRVYPSGVGRNEMEVLSQVFIHGPLRYTYCISRRNCFGGKQLWVL
jgi:hypothetical protein